MFNGVEGTRALLEEYDLIQRGEIGEYDLHVPQV
jgi:hypothetical protein